MGRKGITINLQTTLPEGEVRVFKSIPEAARELGFSERGVRKAYHAGRDRTGEYQLEWLKVEDGPVVDPEVVARIERTKAALDTPKCSYCGKPLTRADRTVDGFRIISLGADGLPNEEHNVKGMYEARKATGLSLHSLANAADKGNIKIRRRKDGKEFLISWGKIHDVCFEIRRQERRKQGQLS